VKPLVGLLLALATCLGCAAASLAPTPRVTSCAERYMACAPIRGTGYGACRAMVDRDCLDGGP
jgi:hypothetical protein